MRGEHRALRWVIAIVVVLLVAACTSVAAAPIRRSPDQSKWIRLRTVGTPGIDERFQTGTTRISIAAEPPQPIIAGVL
jgi:hypothetical protein